MIFVLYNDIIGAPDSPVNVVGIETTPQQVITVEWQEPYSHKDHPISYYTVYQPNNNETNVSADTEQLTFTIVGNEELNDVCGEIIMITATNDIAESKPSIASILKG